MKADRQLGIVYLLMKKGTMPAAELAERYEVSVRTIYRDIETLCMAGIPVCTKKGKKGGISLEQSFILDRMLITKEEQQEILAALNSLQEVGAQKEQEILQKLGDFFQQDSSSWVSIDFSDWSGRRKELFEQLRRGILHHQVLAFDYYGQYGEMTSRCVEPIQLLFKEYTWYLRAWCRTRQAMRLFKVLRMKRVVTLEETFQPDPGRYQEKPGMWQEDAGSCREKPGTWQEDAGSCQENSNSCREKGESVCQRENSQKQKRPVTELVLSIASSEAYRVYDRFEEEEIAVQEDGSFLVKTWCLMDDWAYGMILSFGPAIRVVEPVWVRDEIRRRLLVMVEKC